MANNKQVQIGIGFDVDNSGLKIAEKELQNLHTQLGKISVTGKQAKGIDEYSKGLKEAGETASKLSSILEKSFSAKLGTINVTKFKQELDKAGMSTKSIQASLQKAGQEGSAAFARLGTALLSTNVQIKKSNTLLDEMATTMANTVKWGVTSSIFNNISNSVQDAYHYVKQLDSSLNDIRIVTDKSAESMAKFAVQANNAAKNLGASTRDYTDASLIYYQQGLSDRDVAARAETTLKAANVTGQNTAEVSEQLTAVWNGYKVSAQEAELYVDKLAAVAATTASDLEELSTGMSKVASAANLMGVDIDQLNAQLATIVSVTRQAPESVGTALKTIYARMGDIEAGIDTETTLGNYTKEMEAMGFNVLDANGNLRDMGAVIEEIGAKWTTLSREQQIALSQTMAGTRQYNNLLSLFDNWDMYTEAMNTSAEAAGTLQKQQDTYMESTEAHLQQLKTSAEDIYDTLIKTEEINAIIDIFKSGTEVLGTFFDTFGGGISSMVASAAILSGIFSKQIGQGLGSLFTQKTEEQRNADIFAVKKDLVKQKIEEKGEKEKTPEDTAVLANYEKQEQISNQILQNQKGITNEQYQQRVELQNKIGQLEEEKILIKEQFKASKEAVGIENIDALFGDDGEAQIKILSDLAQQAETAKIEIQKLNKELDKIEDEDDKNAKLEEIKEQESIVERSNAAAKAVSQYEQKNIEQQGHQVDLDINLEDDAKLANLANTFDIIGNSAETAMIAIGGVKSIIDILNNEDLTFGEKLGQSFILLATTLPMVINSVKTVTSALKETNAITSVWNTLIKIGSAENGKNAASEALLALAKKASAKASKDKAAAMDKDSKETKENTIQNIVNGAAEKGKAGVKNLASAGKGLVSIFQAIPPQAYLVVAAIAAIGAVCYATYKESIKYDEALKQANKTQKEVSENLAETKTAYEQTLSAISNYSNSKTALQDLTKGTREWNEAVLELNNNVLSLMEKYPELAAEIENNNGVLEISQKGLDSIIEKESAKVKQAQESLYLANTNVTQAESQKLYHKDFKLERKNENDEVISQNSVDDYSDDVNKILEEINKGNSAFLKDTSAISRVLNHSYDAELYKENAAALMELAAQLQANEAIVDANNQLLADSLLQDKKEYSNMSEDEQKIASTLLAEQMQDFQKQVSTQGYGDRKKLLNDIDFLTGANDINDAKLVLQALGKNVEDYEIQHAGGSEFQYRKKGSDEEFVDMSYADNVDAVYNYVKSKEIAEEYGLDYLAEKFSKLDTQIGTTTSNIISKFLATGGELSNLSEVELEAVRTALENGDLSADLIDSVFRQEQLEALGYKNGEAVVEGLKQSVQKENILKDAFDKTFKHAGNQGVQAFEKVLDGVDENTYSKLAYAMEQIDWGSSHALADLNAILEQQGISLNTATTAWENYAKAMRDGIGLIDAATLKQNQQEVAKIINDLDTGDRISAEEYEKIQSQSAAAASLFVEEITGEYRLVSSQGTLAELFFGDFESQALRNIALLQQLQVLVSDIENKNAWQGKVQEATDTSQSVSENGGHYDAKGHAVLNYGGDVANAAFAKFGISQDEFSRATSTIDAYGAKDYDTLDDENKAKVDAARELIDKVYNYIDEVFSNPEVLDEDIQKNKETVAVQHQSSSSLDSSFSQAATESQDTTDNLKDLKAQSDQLRSIASGYETCSDELAEYNKILETQSEDSEDARKAYQKLNKAVKQAEWKKMAKEVAPLVKEMKKLTKGTEEYDKKAQDIANSINTAFGTNVTKEFYEENEQLINEWANSTGDKASELTMKIHELAALGDMDIDFDITANDQVTSKFASIQEKQAALKSVIEANPITINAQGQADMSQLIAGLSQAGASAEWVAKYLASIGHTNISISTDNLPTQDIDLSSEEGIAQFMEMWNEANGAGLNVTGQVPDVAPSMASSGGGGGGGSKAQSAKKQDKFKADIDPFHEINEQIELLNTTLDKLAKKQEKAFGKDLIANLKEQNEKIQKQNENLKEKIKITDKEIAQEKYKMQNLKVAGKKVKVSFNKDGSIANYDEALAAAEKNVNDLVKKYNKVAKKKYKEGSQEDTDRKNLEKAVEKAKNDFNKLQELMDAYDENLISKKDLINQIQDNIDQTIENNATIFTTAIEIKLEVNDIRASYNDFMSEWDSLTSKQPLKVKIENELANTNIFKDNIQNATKMVTQTQAELAKIQKGETSKLFGDNEKLAYDTLKEYTTQLQNSLGDIQSAYQSAQDTVLDGMDAVNDSLNEQIENMSFYADSIQHVININEKLYGEQEAAAKNQQYYKNLAQQNTETISTLKQNADYWKTQMDAMKGVNEEAYKKAKENYISATQEMQSALETSLEDIQAALENSIKSIFETFTNGLTPENWGFDNMLKDWEMAVSESETYLTNIDQANKLKQLELKYQQAIDKSSSLSTQKELLTLKQKELNALREQGKLTQYDIDRANKKLQLRLAEIALEEAQNNKSKLRLRRDSQGNYSYQYVADEDAIAKKQAEVDNLKTEMSNDDFKYFKENVTNALSGFDTFKQEFAELLASGASEEERQEFLSNYAQKMSSQSDLFNDSINYLLSSTAEATGQNLDKMTDKEKEQMLKSQFGEDIMSSGALEFLLSLSDNTKTAEDATKYLTDNIYTLAEKEIEWAEQQEETASKYAGYGEDFELMGEALGKINEEVATFNKDSETTTTNLKAQLEGVQEIFSTIQTVLSDPAVQAGLKALKEAVGKEGDTDNGSLTAGGSNDQAGDVADTSNTTEIENTDAETEITQEQETNQGNKKLNKGDTVKLKKKDSIYKYVKKEKKFSKTKDKANKNSEYNVQEVKKVNKTEYAKISAKENKWVKKSSLKGFDTGGYTGRWNSSEGRLALLHQKELVLNAKDTENMLKMLDISRSMTSVMSSVSNKIKDMMYHIDKSNHIKEMSNHKMRESELVGQLEQNVHIEATFPNVSQSHEIETAFNNLINVAAQRAYKNRR